MVPIYRITFVQWYRKDTGFPEHGNLYSFLQFRKYHLNFVMFIDPTYYYRVDPNPWIWWKTSRNTDKIFLFFPMSKLNSNTDSSSNSHDSSSDDESTPKQYCQGWLKKKSSFGRWYTKNFFSTNRILIIWNLIGPSFFSFWWTTFSMSTNHAPRAKTKNPAQTGTWEEWQFKEGMLCLGFLFASTSDRKRTTFCSKLPRKMNA